MAKAIWKSLKALFIGQYYEIVDKGKEWHAVTCSIEEVFNGPRKPKEETVYYF